MAFSCYGIQLLWHSVAMALSCYLEVWLLPFLFISHCSFICKHVTMSVKDVFVTFATRQFVRLSMHWLPYIIVGVRSYILFQQLQTPLVLKDRSICLFSAENRRPCQALLPLPDSKSESTGRRLELTFFLASWTLRLATSPLTSTVLS